MLAYILRYYVFVFVFVFVCTWSMLCVCFIFFFNLWESETKNTHPTGKRVPTKSTTERFCHLSLKYLWREEKLELKLNREDSVGERWVRLYLWGYFCLLQHLWFLLLLLLLLQILILLRRSDRKILTSIADPLLLRPLVLPIGSFSLGKYADSDPFFPWYRPILSLTAC